MADMYYTVFADANSVARGDVLAEGKVTMSGTSASSSAITGDTGESRIVRIFCDGNAYVNWGDAPNTATNDGTGGRIIGSENPKYFEIKAGQVISVIERT